ncbi:phage major capsid protein, P2 family [Oceanobacter kriegii]|uniref:phage major capsid protein, P2 family n=1 Tax=Oceanobacter kriegii TaxID=64972 RepID=UPI0004209E53|nr:phage major capsid protein, P2 family [Oceanobacter kriegii]
MNEVTTLAFNGYVDQVYKLNGVARSVQKFTVTPTIQQKLMDKMAESADVLKKINIVPVDELSGEKIGLGTSGTIAGNTDTSDGNTERQTSDPSNMTGQTYECKKNNFDTHLSYKKLDLWAKFKDFQVRVRNHNMHAEALDRCRILWNGTSYAANSNRTNNPLLQDVNVGVLQHYRDDAPDRVMDEAEDASGVINVYAGGDYENLDALVEDAVETLIDPWHKDDTALVAIMNRKMLSDKYFPLINQQQPSSEVLATQLVIAQKRVGEVQAVAVPFFPENTILITTWDNLSIYYQSGGRRRHILDNPKKDRVENYESSNDAYVVEDYGRGCLIENINTVAP